MKVFDNRLEAHLDTSKKWKDRFSFSKKDISLLTGIPPSTIGQLIHAGEMRAAKCGRKWLVTRKDLLSWWLNCQIEGANHVRGC